MSNVSDSSSFTNISTGVSADGTPLIPSSYEVDKCELTNQFGDVVDIYENVISLSVVSELYSPVLTCKVRIRDNINLFEDFRISGHEKLKLRIRKKDTPPEDAGGEGLILDLIVREYPDFSKTGESINVQEYDMIAVSSWAYVNRMKKISRSVAGDVVGLIKDVFKKDLAFSDDDFMDDSNNVFKCNVNFKGIITKQYPVNAVEFLRKKAYDTNGSPFFVYSLSNDNKIQIKSWSTIRDINNKIYPEPDGSRPYHYKPFETKKTDDPEYNKSLKQKILSISSNIKLNKLQQAEDGGFGNVLEVFDFNSKTFSPKIYEGEKDELELSDEKVGSGGIFNKKLNKRIKLSNNLFEVQPFDHLQGLHGFKTSDITDSSTYQLYVPPLPYEGSNDENAATIYEKNIQKTRLFAANLEAVTHNIVVYGDFLLNPGVKIKIKIPKAGDPDEAENKDNDDFDESLSGKYIISVVSHNFTNGVHTSQLKLIKDIDY